MEVGCLLFMPSCFAWVSSSILTNFNSCTTFKNHKYNFYLVDGKLASDHIVEDLSHIMVSLNITTSDRL